MNKYYSFLLIIGLFILMTTHLAYDITFNTVNLTVYISFFLLGIVLLSSLSYLLKKVLGNINKKPGLWRFRKNYWNAE